MFCRWYERKKGMKSSWIWRGALHRLNNSSSSGNVSDMLVGNSTIDNPVQGDSILTITLSDCSAIELSVRCRTSPNDGLWAPVVVERENRVESSASQVLYRSSSSVVWRCTLSGSVLWTWVCASTGCGYMHSQDALTHPPHTGLFLSHYTNYSPDDIQLPWFVGCGKHSTLNTSG